MSKTSVFTTITPLPAGVTRQSVIETYHNHVEMIDLNPLVIERFNCKPPNYAPAEEYYSTWYTIKDKVSYLPGGLASGSVSYHACFHDLADGLQTHVYAPLGLDIRAKWSVGGSMPGEAKQPVELGLNIPREGLYIREDVKMKCNIMMLSFVKKTFKESHSKLVDRLVEKAHILEAKVANERLNGLKTIDPRDRMGHGDIFIAPPPGYTPQVQSQPGHMSLYSNGSGSGHSPQPSPGLSQASTLNSQSPYLNSPPLHQTDHRQSYQPDPKGDFRPSHQQDPRVGPRSSAQPDQRDPRQSYGGELLSNARYDPRQQQQHQRDERHIGFAYSQNAPAELPSEAPTPPPKDNQKFAAELPG